MFAETPEPPYTAVIFSSRRTPRDDAGYADAARRMDELAAAQPGCLGIETARDPATRFGVTVSYWSTEDDARAWKRVAEHVEVQRLGRTRWYEHYEVRIASVTRTYAPRTTPTGGRGPE